jgi:hypothetical protein
MAEIQNGWMSHQLYMRTTSRKNDMFKFYQDKNSEQRWQRVDA